MAWWSCEKKATQGVGLAGRLNMSGRNHRSYDLSLPGSCLLKNSCPSQGTEDTECREQRQSRNVRDPRRRGGAVARGNSETLGVLEFHFVRGKIVISLSKIATSVAPMCLEEIRPSQPIGKRSVIPKLLRKARQSWHCPLLPDHLELPVEVANRFRTAPIRSWRGTLSENVGLERGLEISALGRRIIWNDGGQGRS